ncbi:MAG TPA: hypothetical protein ENK18_27235 [Deltaproteobacteria bacterium]|nr:hypothetical protein [Deltaproteobacteria bacterium]
MTHHPWLRATPLIAIAALLTGCPPSSSCDKCGTAETGLTPPGGCAEPYEGPILIQEIGVTCDDPDTVTFTMDTDGLTSGGLVFSQETGNTDAPYAQWSDEHDLDSVDFDEACGSYDRLARTLNTGVDLNAWEVNTSTVFRCDDDGAGNPYHHNADVMTYAFRAYDLDEVMADCVVAGDDPAGLLAGTYNRANDPYLPGELSGCDVGVLRY